MTDIFTDFALEPDHEGILDLVIDDEKGDLKTVSGMETAIALSLFTDRRARADEVADPLKRRGWDGNLYADRPEDNFGCGYWLWIEQARLTQTEANYARFDTIEALQWMVDVNLASSIDAQAEMKPEDRAMILHTKITTPNGSVVTQAWQLWANTAPTILQK